MNIIFHGAAKEVGRSCIELNISDKKLFLDSGIKVTENGLEYPIGIKNYVDVDAVLLSHAHLDHSGALAFFTKKGLKTHIFCTELTKKIFQLLIKDSHKVELIEKFTPKYSHEDIKKAVNQIKVVQINKQYNIGDIFYTYLPAGHIAGSCSILIEHKNKKILYTGDFNTLDIHSMKGSENYIQNVDYLIIESTYGNRNHQNRIECENEFIENIKNVLKNEGTAIIAAFAVGRIQELVMVLAKANLNVPIYVDGMGNKINKLILESAKNFNDIKDYKDFKKCIKKIKPVSKNSEREEITKNKCIILATSGMLTGGPIIHYIKDIWNDKNSALYLTGYQVKGTNGRLLMDTGKVFLDGVEVILKCSYYIYDFSAHAGMYELHEYIKKIKPKKVILQHGDIDAINAFKEWLNENKFETIVPELEQEIKLD